jgi:hypothetical protein
MTLPQQHAWHAGLPLTRRGAHATHAAFKLLMERLTGPDEQQRLPALRELGDLADHAPELRADVVSGICGFLRSPWSGSTQPGSKQSGERDSGEPRLRRAGVALIADHLRAPDDPVSWSGHDLDLAGAVLAGADFSGCWFTGGRVRLEGAWCIEGGMSFAGARFLGAQVSLRHWNSGQGELSFAGARFSAGTVNLAGLTLLEGSLDLTSSAIDGGSLLLTEARVAGGHLDLSGVTVTAGLLCLVDARFTAGRVLLVDVRLLGGRTVLRHVTVAPGVLSTAGAQILPRTVQDTSLFTHR